MYLRGVVWEYTRNEKPGISFLRLLKISTKYMIIPLLFLTLLSVGLNWAVEGTVSLGWFTLNSAIVIILIPILSIVVHEFCHLLEWYALLKGDSYQVVMLPVQFKMRILFADQNMDVNEIIKILYAGPVGVSILLFITLTISILYHCDLVINVGLVIFLIFNLYTLIAGGDGRRIRQISKAYQIGLGKRIRLLAFCVLEMLGYLMQSKRDKE